MVAVLTQEDKCTLRYEYNMMILKRLESVLTKYQGLRFGQALINIGICEDDFKLWNEESFDMYQKICSPEICK